MEPLLGQTQILQQIGSFEFLHKGNDDSDKLDTMNMLYNVEDENEKD